MENKLITSRVTTQYIEDPIGQCQRNWLDEPVSLEDKQEIIDTILKMPSKQSRSTFKLWVSGDQKLNERIHILAGKDPFDDTAKRYTNGQLSAPLLILFFEDNTVEEKPAVVFRNVGVAAGGAVVRAHQLGYKTGLCICVDNEIARNTIKKYTGHSFRKDAILLALGIGKPNPNYVRNLNFGPNRQSEIYVQPVGPKKISVTEWC